MKKVILLTIAILMSLTLFASKTICEIESDFDLSRAYQVGDVIDQDYSWTDSNGEYHSIHELTSSGKAIIIFWGESW